jgi:predicted amino acid dehydrogenase
MDIHSLTGEITAAVRAAGDRGARCVSLAGMLPSRTGYGFAIAGRTGPDGPAVTTGHAATAVGVVATVEAALAARGAALDRTTVAVLGCGSIGRAALCLLLAVAPAPPERIVLCDVTGSEARLSAFAASLPGNRPIEIRTSTGPAPDAVYRAGLIIAATSAAREPLDAGRLRPGTIVVDDSFPPAVDPAAALARMRSHRDVLVVGGGLLHVGDARRTIVADLPDDVLARLTAHRHMPGTVAACQLESLARAAIPALPLVRGLVDPAQAHAYRQALTDAGVRAAPLHLLNEPIDRTHDGTRDP